MRIADSVTRGARLSAAAPSGTRHVGGGGVSTTAPLMPRRRGSPAARFVRDHIRGQRRLLTVLAQGDRQLIHTRQLPKMAEANCSRKSRVVP
jgi:hypothetical protein